MTIVDFFFGCRHKHHSFPITIGRKTRRGGATSITGTYVVCFDCGKEIPYDWNEMKLGCSESQSGARKPIWFLPQHKLR